MPSCSVPSNLPLCGHWGRLSRPSQGWAVLWAPPGTQQQGRELLLQCPHQNPWETRAGYRTRDRPVRKRFWEPPLGDQVRASGAVGPPFTRRAYLIQPPSKGPTNPRALDMWPTAAGVTSGTNEQRGHGQWCHPGTRGGQRSDSYLFKKTSTQTLCPQRLRLARQPAPCSEAETAVTKLEPADDSVEGARRPTR